MLLSVPRAVNALKLSVDLPWTPLSQKQHLFPHPVALFKNLSSMRIS